MRILLSANACRPDVGSEPGLGWRWATSLARDHEICVLTREPNRPFIERAGAVPGIRFVYVPETISTQQGPRLLWWTAHYLWQLAAYRRAVALHREVRFDLAHHVTFATWRLPTLLWRLGIPLIWGPLGGGQSVPPGFLQALGPAGIAHEAVRAVSQVASRLDPLVRATLARAAVVLAANTPTTAFLRRLGRRDVVQVLETGIPDQVANGAPREASAPIEILWVGSFQPRKALPLLLAAVARLRDGPNLHVTVVGDGSERRRWQAMAERLRLGDRVEFVGRQPYDVTQEYYRRADIFAFTSIRDTSGNVVLEAMAAGIPVITLDWAGGGDMVDSECGVKIPPRSISQAEADLAAAIARLAADPELRRRLGEAGRRRANTLFTWDVLYRRVNEIYRHATAGGRADGEHRA